MAHLHPVYDTDPHFSIDATTRAITYMSKEKLIIAQKDHNSQRYTFEMPRYVDGHDMMLCDKVEVHYINIDSSNSKNRGTGVYKVTDLQISPDSENVVVCSWLISQNATLYVGSLTFVLRFACTSGSKIDYAWGTAVYSSVAISTTIDNANEIVEQYADILETWYMELLSAGTSGVNMVAEARDEALAEIAASQTTVSEEVIADIRKAGEEAIANVEKAESETIKNQKEEIIQDVLGRLPSNPGVSVVQETGTSTENVMSQKAVTDALNDIRAQINYVAPTISTLELTPSTNSFKLPATFTLTKIAHKETQLNNIVGNLTLSRGSTTLKSDIIPSADRAEISVSDTVTLTPSGVTYVLKGTDKKGNTISKSVNISAYYVSYIGSSQSSTASDALFSELGVFNAGSLAGERMVTVAGASTYVWFVSTKAITSIKSGGFDVPFTLVNGSYSYNGTTYKCYRTSEKVSAGTHTFVIA